MAVDRGDRKSLESVERTVRILHSFDGGRALMLAEIARRAVLSEATALRYLSSLCNVGFVERTENNRYQLGWELFRLGQLAIDNQVPRDVVLPVMEQLRDRFSETVNLALRRGDELVIVEVLPGTRGLKKVNEVGQHDPWHASALGKAMLAWMETDERRGLLDRAGLKRLTAHTIVSKARLDRELDEARGRGWAMDDEESEEGLTCVGAPVVGPNGVPSLAVSVSFLTHRLGERELDEAGPAVRDAAHELERRLGYHR